MRTTIYAIVVLVVLVLVAIQATKKDAQTTFPPPPDYPPKRKYPPQPLPPIPPSSTNKIINKAKTTITKIAKITKDEAAKVAKITKDEFVGTYRVAANGPKDQLCGGAEQGGESKKDACCAVQWKGDGKTLFKGCMMDLSDPIGCMKNRGCPVPDANPKDIKQIKEFCDDHGGAANKKCFTDRGVKVCSSESETDCYPNLYGCTAFSFNSDVAKCRTDRQGGERCAKDCCKIQMVGKGGWPGCVRDPNPALCMKNRGCTLSLLPDSAMASLVKKTNDQCKGINGGGQNKTCYTDRGVKVCKNPSQKNCWPNSVPCENFGTFDSKYGKCGTDRQGPHCKPACCRAQWTFCKGVVGDNPVDCMAKRGCSLKDAGVDLIKSGKRDNTVEIGPQKNKLCASGLSNGGWCVDCHPGKCPKGECCVHSGNNWTCKKKVKKTGKCFWGYCNRDGTACGTIFSGKGCPLKHGATWTQEHCPS